MKSILSAKRSIAQMYRQSALRRGVSSLRKVKKTEPDFFSHPLPQTGLNLNIMSFNIRHGAAKDGKHHWIYRRDRVCELLSEYRPDVLGLQEAMDFQISAISAALPGHVKLGIGNLGGNKGLHTAIFYDAVRFIPSAEGTFWFSDTPEIPGSTGWGNVIPRTCTWARLIEKESGQAFYFFNVHLDHISQRSRKNSVVVLTRFIHARASRDPFVLAGDFNAREKSKSIHYLKGKTPLRVKAQGSVFNPEPLIDTFRVRYPHRRNVVTYHGFRRFFFRFRLDYIFVPPSVRVQAAQIIQPRWKKHYPSDHFPLLTRIDLSDISASVKSGASLEKAAIAD
ncbi:MAG: endonuclease/exonuclease/phosphatase family protein [Deltaproteobacteria bacterium]|nr:endonuclease/exonuclease/phosphatase family protein [Deltaproteobacteria bacterium]